MLDMMLDEFPFTSLWNSGVFLFVAFAAVIYLFLLPQDNKHLIWKSLVFFLGLIVIFIATGSPLNIIGRIQFSAHIVQVVLLSFIAPPLLIIGMKKRFFHRTLKNTTVAKIASHLTKPYITIGLFLIILYAYHHPPIFDQARVDLYGNYLYLIVLFITAILLWMPIFTKKHSARLTLFYHIMSIGLVVPLGAILLFSEEILYHAYTDMTTFTQALEVCLPPGQSLSPELALLLLPFEPITEQQIGGIIWLASGIVVFITSFFIKLKLNNN